MARDGFRGPVAVALAFLLAACCSQGTIPAAGAPSSPQDSPPLATAVSADGRYRMELVNACWQGGGRFELDRALWLAGRLVPGDPDLLLLKENPLRRAVTPDGVEHPVEFPEGSSRTSWFPGPDGVEFVNLLALPGEPTRLAVLEYEVALLRVGAWETVSAEVPANGTAALVAGPFRILLEAGPQVCGLRVSRGGSGPLDNEWAARATEVIDAEGVRLEWRTWDVEEDAPSLHLIRSGVGTSLSPAIAYPVTARLRFPRESATEVARFEVRDLDLPPARDPVTRIREAYPEREPAKPDGSGWSEPTGGLSLRVSLPPRAFRGDPVPVGLALRFDAATLPGGVTQFDARCVEDSMHLLLRNRATGESVMLRDVPEDPDRVVYFDGAPLDDGMPDGIPAREPNGREWILWFPLARVWDRVVPGDWEVRVVLEAESGRGGEEFLSGTFVSRPLPLRVEEPPPRRERFLVPTNLHLRRGHRAGTIEVVHGPWESEVVELEIRNGFSLGVKVREGDDTRAEFWGSGDCGPVVTTLHDTPPGPVDRRIVIEILESSRNVNMGELTPGDEEEVRVLWTRTLRVQATAPEVEALRR